MRYGQICRNLLIRSNEGHFKEPIRWIRQKERAEKDNINASYVRDQRMCVACK